MRALVVALVLLQTALADAAPRGSVRARSDLRIVFLAADEAAPVRQGPLGDATVDVGTARCATRCMRTVIRRRFRMRVDGGSPVGRFVRVSAFVQGDTPGQRIRLDGRVLTAAPQLIDAAAPLHVAVVHTLEIEVPASEPAGPLAQTISWIVEEP